MKYFKNILLILSVCFLPFHLVAQDSTAAKAKPVKNTFGSVWLMDNQTVIVPIKGTFEFDIQHRFGTIENEASDLFGLFAPSNIRLALSYAPISNLFLGAGITKERMQVDLNGKYALLHQTIDNRMPLSVTYFGNIVIDARDESNFKYDVYRLSYFNQLIVARKITDRFSAQVAPSFSWYNNVPGYLDENGEVQRRLENGHFAIATMGRFKISDNGSVIAGYDQPLTQHNLDNPHPNICFGYEVTTSSHAFQVFMGNYYGIVPQSNNFFNQNDYQEGQFLIGFNITRLWNF